MPRWLKTTLAKVAAREERRKLARDLHDGLAQELAFMAIQSRALAQSGGGDGVFAIAEAADRALEHSRALITGLTSEDDGSLASAVAAAARRLAARSGARLHLELDPRADRRREARSVLLPILREAISNGVRHGQASEFSIELTCRQGLRFRVADNGCGFDTSRADSSSPRSFGLISMTERARSAGGELHVRSRPGLGTAVEVVLP